MPARKRFGQNFLRDRNTIDRIIAAIDPRPDDHVVEIGPGHGALTDRLVNSGCRLDIIEIDFDLVDELEQKYGPAAHVIKTDVLKYDFAELDASGPLRVVGNLPYNISTPLMFKLFGELARFRDMYFMLQLEVVNRMIASPSTSEYGRLSVMCQYYCDVSRLFSVPASAFQPQPKVTSAVVRLEPRGDDLKRVQDVKLLEQLLGRAFSQRRKTIRNAMKPFLSVADLAALELDPQLRPENLSPAQYIDCANYISSRRPQS